MRKRSRLLARSTVVGAFLVTLMAPTSSYAAVLPNEDTPAPEVSNQEVAATPTLAELEASVTALSARAAEINTSLTAATLAYETGVAELETAKAAAAAAETRAKEAEVKAVAAKEKMGDFARSSYINPVPDSAAFLSATSGSPATAAKGVEYLDRIGRDNSDQLTEAARVRQVALTERTAADSLKAAADLKATELTTQLQAVQAEAEAAAVELSAKVLELDETRLRIESTMNGTAAFFDTGTMTELCATTTLTPAPETPEWGGFSNGLIPPSALCAVAPGQALRWDAAAAFRALNTAYTLEFNAPLCITDSYRPYEAQVTLFSTKPGMAATPGTSNHGWGLAVDLCGGVESFSTPQYAWMLANAPSFGWYNPPWALQGGSGTDEPWHWNYGTFN